MTEEKWIAQIEAHEMACRICEAMTGWKRDPGKTPEIALSELAAQGEVQKEAVGGFYRAALAAGLYMEEAINDYQRVQ